MIENIDLSLVDWSRGQFALTAIYHWLFVPLTLGLAFIIAMMETLYVRTGDEEWKRITKFWMKLFGINFAIGVATGIILEFEFGTNWSNYSWFVGDIFGAPLAIEGIFAFFLESTFIAVMFFGWNKVSKKFHLLSTWLVAIGANLSALWILVANAWMENPVGMWFNPDAARNEMIDFWAVLFNPVAVDKFLHTITSSFVLASVVVIAISSWFLLKRREKELARKSILVSGVFGVVASLFLVFTGDTSARTLSQVQPVKFAAFEALYEGTENAGLVAAGVLKKSGEYMGDVPEREFIFRIEIPGLLSVMTAGDKDAYVPGLRDYVYGNEKMNILPASEKIARGQVARDILFDYKKAKEADDVELTAELKSKFENPEFLENYFQYFGYAFLNAPEDILPNVPIAFYSFHIMVILGFYFWALCGYGLWLLLTGRLEKQRWFLWVALLSLPLPYLASELGWVVTEMGRQPWIIQDMMPVSVAVSHISATSVQITFWLFAALFTSLLIAEVSIMIGQIRNQIKDKEE